MGGVEAGPASGAQVVAMEIWTNFVLLRNMSTVYRMYKIVQQVGGQPARGGEDDGRGGNSFGDGDEEGDEEDGNERNRSA